MSAGASLMRIDNYSQGLKEQKLEVLHLCRRDKYTGVGCLIYHQMTQNGQMENV